MTPNPADLEWFVGYQDWRDRRLRQADPNYQDRSTDRALHFLARPVTGCGASWAGRECVCDREAS